jgi:hypothetical protein
LERMWGAPLTFVLLKSRKLGCLYANSSPLLFESWPEGDNLPCFLAREWPYIERPRYPQLCVGAVCRWLQGWANGMW